MTKNIDLGNDLRTIVTLRAWQDKAFADKVRQNPKAAVKELANEIGLDIPDIEFTLVDDTKDVYHLVLAENPVGAAPGGLQPESFSMTGGGTVNSYTADCGCAGTYTGDPRSKIPRGPILPTPIDTPSRSDARLALIVLLVGFGMVVALMFRETL